MMAPLCTLWRGTTPALSAPWRCAEPSTWLVVLLALCVFTAWAPAPVAFAQGAAVADEEDVEVDEDVEEESGEEEMADDEADEEDADEEDDYGVTVEPGELKTVAVAAISGYDALMKDVGFIGELGGRAELANMAEGMIALFTQGRGIVGLDKTRPVGVVLQTDGTQFIPVACVPVTDLKAIFEVVTGFGFEPVALEDGVTEIELPDQTLYVKEAGEWAFVAQTAAALASAPEDPLPTFEGLVKSYDIGVQVSVQNVPEMYRTVAIEQLRLGMEQGLEQQEDADEETLEAQRKMAEMQVEQITQLIEGLDELTVGWSLDNDARSTYLDLAFTAVPGTMIARGCEIYKNSKTDFAAFVDPKAAASFHATGDTPAELIEEQREQIDAGIEMMRTQANKGIDEMDELGDDEKVREDLKSAVSDFIDAYQALALSGRADLAASMTLGKLAGADGELGIVAGGFVKESAKIVSGMKKIAAVAKAQSPDIPDAEWDYATHAGVKLSRLVLPIPAEEAEQMPDAIRDMLGESLSVVMGIGGESAYIAAGPAAEAQLKAAIDGSASRQGVATTPFVAEMSVMQFVKFAQKVAPDDESKPVMNMIADAFKDLPADKDHLRASGKPIENGLLIRYEAEEAVLKAIGAAAAAAQQMQQGGGDGEF
ncbi:MAG: hypothetical protein ACRCT8_10745 [Lacipirellulaceae bacterium]